MQLQSNQQRGFTLLEIILTVAILGIIAAAFLPLLTQSSSGIARTKLRSDALYRAQSQIEYPQAFTGSDTQASQLITFSTNGTPKLTLNGSLRSVTTDSASLSIYNPGALENL